jgi:hypothetical protein
VFNCRLQKEVSGWMGKEARIRVGRGRAGINGCRGRLATGRGKERMGKYGRIARG